MRLNTPGRNPVLTTAEGAPAKHISDEKLFRRSVMACLLWESQFYESGQTIAERIVELVSKVPLSLSSKIAIEARSKFHLRHVPLLIASAMANHVSNLIKTNPKMVNSGLSKIVEDTIFDVIQRADELSEFLAIHAKLNGVNNFTVKSKLSHPIRRGLSRAFSKFDEFHLSRYSGKNSSGSIQLRDVMLLCHAKPQNAEQEALYGRLRRNELVTADTWENELSAGANKKETFERLIREGKLGYLALLRNLRGMMEAGCDIGLVREAVIARKGAQRVLPFRYVAAARACPQLEPAIQSAMLKSIEDYYRFDGETIVLVDVSGSMKMKLSERSDLTRMDAAAALACILNGNVRTFTFSDLLVEVPTRQGIAGIEVINKSQPNNGTWLGQAVADINKMPHDRLIVITDEQSYDPVPDPVAKRAYMINVASNKNGVGYGKWTNISGFSENVIRYIFETERLDVKPTDGYTYDVEDRRWYKDES